MGFQIAVLAFMPRKTNSLSQIPVYKGCSTALNGSKCCSDGFHGYDGMGDVPHLYPMESSALQIEHSSLALVNLAQKYKGLVLKVN